MTQMLVNLQCRSVSAKEISDFILSGKYVAIALVDQHKLRYVVLLCTWMNVQSELAITYFIFQLNKTNYILCGPVIFPNSSSYFQKYFIKTKILDQQKEF